jgi:hypothetical protein
MYPIRLGAGRSKNEKTRENFAGFEEGVAGRASANERTFQTCTQIPARAIVRRQAT